MVDTSQYHLFPPASAAGFDWSGAVPCPAAGTSATVLEFRVPVGKTGVIHQLSHNYTGGGFVDGEGSMVWRCFADAEILKNYGNIPFQFGSIAAPRKLSMPLLIASGRKFRYVVDNLTFIPGSGSNIVCTVSGFFF